MCLAVIAIDSHPDWPLIVAANRDEFHARPAQPMQPWHDTPEMLAGKDLLAGGTWLGVTTGGKFALLTNVRDPTHHRHHAPTRGVLVERYLRRATTATQYLDRLTPDAAHYNGFNLILGEPDGRLWHASNTQTSFYSPIEPGIHGISNAQLDTPWPKTLRTTEAMKQLLGPMPAEFTPDVQALLNVMLDTSKVPDERLPSTGISLERERLLASPFIVSDDYGTRCTTLLFRHRTGWQWVQEDTHNIQGQRMGRVRYWSRPEGPWQPTAADPGSLNTDC